MSYKKNSDPQQLSLTDSFAFLPAKTQKIVERSWAKDFAEIVFPAIDEDRFAILYSKSHNSRPNTPVNIVVGGMILKELLGLSDDELLDSICCDVRFQYALHITSYKESPISDRTFSRFRERLYNYEVKHGVNLLEDEMEHLADVFSKCVALNKSFKRMDSTMVAMHARTMSRLTILYHVNADAVKLIHRLGKDELIPSDMLHYLDADDENEVIYYNKDEDDTPKLQKEIDIAIRLKEIISDDLWAEFPEYKLLTRVINEQAILDSEDGKHKPRIKKDISAQSLQNPVDPDATFRMKAGEHHQGYVGNVVETVDEEGRSFITSMSYEINSHSDQAFMQEYLKSDAHEAGETIIADGAYGGSKNHELAQSDNTQLICTGVAGRKVPDIAADFELDETGKTIIKCPNGEVPVKSSTYKNGIQRMSFSKCRCENCPYHTECIVAIKVRTATVSLSPTAVVNARYMRQLKTDEYKVMTRKRNPIEGIFSVLRRKYHIDSIPTYGLLRSKVFFILKVGAYNFQKLRKYRAESAQLAANAC